MRLEAARRALPAQPRAASVENMRRALWFHIEAVPYRRGSGRALPVLRSGAFFASLGKSVTLPVVQAQFFQRAHQGIARAGNAFLRTLAPPLCPITGEEVSGPALMSPAGWSALHFIERPFCRRCGVPFSVDYGAEVECPACIAEPPVFDRARAALVYDDASHELVVGFKHADRTELAPMFARWMRRAGADLISADSVIAPVPLHRRRLAGRRYNQSAILAAHLAREAGAVACLDALKRVRATPPQKDLSAEARRRNVAGAFRVNEKRRAQLRGAHVIIIDDVLTTGATLSAAARCMANAGAARVDALVLARVVKGGVGAI